MDIELNNFGNYEASAAPVQSIDINAFAKEADPEADYVKEFVRRERERERLGQAEAIRGVFEGSEADAFSNIRADWNRVRDADALIARDRYFDDEPDTAARKYELERQTGIPSYLMSDPEVMGEAERRVWSENTRELLRGAPQTVTEWLNEPRNWAIAKDDAAVLAEVGRAWETLGKMLRPKTALVAPEPDANLPAGIRQGLKDAYFNEHYTQIMNEKYGPDAVWGLLPSFLQSISNYANIKVQRAEMDKFAYESGKFSSRLPAGIAMALNKDEMAASAQRSADFWAGIRDYTEQKNLVSRGIGDDVVQNMFYTLSGMPMSIALTLGGTMIAGPIGTVVGAGFSSLLATDAESHGEQAAAYHEMVAAGMDRGEAYDKSYREVYIPNFALLYLSNFAEDILTFGGGAGQSRKIARGLMKAGVSGSYARKIARFMGRGMKFRNALAVGFGGISEGVEEIGQGVIQNLALDRENDWAQLGYEGVVGILNGVMFGGIGSGLRAGIEKLKTYRNDMNASRAANAYNAQVERIQQISAASAVLQRSPETFAEFQTSAANNSPAYIDAAVFNQILGESANEAVEQLGISAEEVQSAAAVGGYIEFDAGKMTPEIWGALKDDIRSTEDGMSVNEARAFEAEQGKTIAELRQSVETELRTLGEFGAMARSVHEGIRKQILALGHAKFGAREAEANAAIYTAMLSQIAQKTGMTIEQVADMAKLRFTTGADGNVNVSGSRAVFGGSFDDIGSAMDYVPTWSERQGDMDPESANGGLNGLFNRRAFLLTAGEKLSAISKRKAYRDGTYSEFVRNETAALKAEAESELAELRGIHGDAALNPEQMNRARAFNARMDALVEAYGGEAYAMMDKGPFEAVFRQGVSDTDLTFSDEEIASRSVPVNGETFSALRRRLGDKGAYEYSGKRRGYLDNLLKTARDTISDEQAELFKAEKNILSGALGAMKGGNFLKASDIVDSIPITAQPPVKIKAMPDSERVKTKDGTSFKQIIDNKIRDSRLYLLDKNGSKALGRIEGADSAGIKDGDVRLDARQVYHIDETHGEQILSKFEDIETCVLDVLRNWKEIYEGTDNSYLLTKKISNSHSSIAAVRIIKEKGDFYSVRTVWITDDLGDKKPLFTRNEPESFDTGTEVGFKATNTWMTGVNLPDTPPAIALPNSGSERSIQQNGGVVNNDTTFNQSSVFDEDDPRTWGNYPRKAEAVEAAVRMREIEEEMEDVGLLSSDDPYHDWPDGAEKRRYLELDHLVSNAERMQLELSFDDIGTWLPKYAQESRKADDIDFEDPQTWPEGKERDKAIALLAEHAALEEQIFGFDDNDPDTWFTDEFITEGHELSRLLNDLPLGDEGSPEAKLYDETEAKMERLFARVDAYRDKLMVRQDKVSDALSELSESYQEKLEERNEILFEKMESEIEKEYEKRQKELDAFISKTNAEADKKYKALEKELNKVYAKFEKMASEAAAVQGGETVFSQSAVPDVFTVQFGGSTADIAARAYKNGNIDFTDAGHRIAKYIAKSDEFAFSTRIPDDNRAELEAQLRGNMNAQSSVSESDQVRAQYEGTEQWLKAPNGESTNLSEQQWLTVRTPAFKNWFGDWENDPANASKVLDENGEPLVVWHGTQADIIGSFAFDYAFANKNGSGEGRGFYTTSDRDTAEKYTKIGGGSGSLIEGFVNMRKPLPLDNAPLKKFELRKLLTAIADSEAAENGGTWRDSFLANYTDTYDPSMNEYKAVTEAMALMGDSSTLLEQISDLGNAIGGWQSVTSHVKNILGYDGVISNGYSNKGEGGGTIYVSWFANDIKSATDNSGAFDAGNDDIYHQGSVTVRGESRFRKDSAGKHVETLVAVMKDGDRSTLVHEAAHVWLQMMIGMTGDADITFNDAAVEDWQKLTKWLGIDDIDFTNGLSEENEARYRNAHEKFASAFEKYLREGRAPNTALKRVFADFKRWLCAIYRAAKDIMYTDTEGRQVPFEISDDIRAVMDRILASEEEIELAASMRESFTEKVKDGAKEKLLVKLMGELSEQKQKEKAKLRDELRPGMRDEVSERREYRTLAAFTELPVDEGGIRLNGEGVNEDLKFALPGVIDDKNGYHIDFAAELLGYQSADELTADLLTASQNPIDEVVEGMLEDAVETSIIDDASSLRTAAEEALHGKQALDKLAEIAALFEDAAGLNPELKTASSENTDSSSNSENRSSSRSPEKTKTKEKAKAKESAKLTREQVRAWRSAAEDAAIEAAAGMNIGKLTPGRYMLSERRHAEAALRAALRGDAETAFEHKRAELFSHAMAAEAMRVREDYEKGMRLLNKYWPNRGRLRGAIGGNAFAQIMGVLERFNINGSDPMSANRPTLNEWIAGKQAESNDVNVGSGVAQWIRDAEVRGQRFRVRDLTVSEFEDLITAVKAIDRLGRNEREIIIDGRTKRFDDAVGDMMQQYTGDFGEVELRDIDPNDDKSFAGALRDKLGGFLGTMCRPETLTRIMDKGRDFGKWWSHFYKPIQDASNREIVMKRDSNAAVESIFRKHFGSDKQIRAMLNRRLDTGLINPKDGKAVYWTGENLVGAMLNWGNAKGRERLVFGMGFAENANAAMGGALDLSVNMDEGGYQELLSVGSGMIEDLFAREATPQMWAFCQDVWDHIDTYWAETAALEERVNGYAPMKVQALPFITADGTEMRGGYYPIRFNAAKDAKTAEHQSADTMKALYEDQVHKPNTRHGHTKERVERVIGKQLNLSLGVINEHLENVIHDITHREAIRDVNRLIDSEPLKRAMYRVIGRHGQNQFRPWVQFLANPTYMADGAERLMSFVVGRVMANGLGFNVVSSMSQIAASVPACWKLGIDALPALANVITGRALWSKEWVDEMCRKSPELADRFKFGPEMTLRDIDRITESSAGVRIKNKVSASLYCFISWMDKVVAAPVWQAAYDKALNDGMSDGDAVNYADMILRMTNNPSALKERTQIMRGGILRKIFTMYYSMYSSMYSMYLEEQTLLKRRGLPGLPRMAAFSFMVFVLQSSLTEALKMRGPEGSGDDDELTIGDIAKWGAKNGVMSFAGMFPFFRDVVSGVGSAVGYRMSPVSDVGDSVGKFLNQSSKALNALYDGGDWDGEQLAREAVRMFGYASGLPGPQLWKWHKALSKWAEENWAPEKSMEFLRDAIYGVKEKKK